MGMVVIQTVLLRNVAMARFKSTKNVKMEIYKQGTGVMLVSMNSVEMES